jgi:hypothetical protein
MNYEGLRKQVVSGFHLPPEAGSVEASTHSDAEKLVIPGG